MNMCILLICLRLKHLTGHGFKSVVFKKQTKMLADKETFLKAKNKQRCISDDQTSVPNQKQHIIKKEKYNHFPSFFV